MLAGESVSSSLYGIPGESGKGYFRQGGIELNFDPPRLRTSYEIQDVTIQLPLLELFPEIKDEESEKINGTFGWIALLKVGGVSYYSEPIPAQGISLPKGTSRQYKPVQTAQLQFSQSIVVSQGIDVSLEVLGFISITSGELPSATVLASPGEERAHPGNPIVSATMVYTQESPRGNQR